MALNGVKQGDAVTQQRRGLGKGLGALIPAAAGTGEVGSPAATRAGGTPEQRAVTLTEDGAAGAQPIAGAYFEEVPTGAITPNPRQPRRTFDEEALEELASSIREVGLLQPVVVRQVMPGRYELIMGERRWRASQRADLKLIPAIVRETADTDLLRDALIENLHRQQLDPLEEAAAYQQLLDDFGATHEQLARKIGRSRPHISNTLRLLNLPPAVQKRVAAGVLGAGHARALLSLESPDAQERPRAPDRGRGSLGAGGRGDRGRGGRGASEAATAARRQACRSRPARPGRPAVRRARDPGQGGTRPA